MGNNPSRQGLALVAMAKYMSLTKEQVLLLQRSCNELASQQGESDMISLDKFRQAMIRAAVQQYPDQDVLENMFTMWDLTGESRVLQKEFVVGISALACPCEGLQKTLSFVIQVMDFEKRGEISAKQLVTLLKSKFAPNARQCMILLEKASSPRAYFYAFKVCRLPWHT